MNKVVLISGCSSNLGKTLAESLSKKGCKVFAGIRNKDSLKRLSLEWADNPNITLLSLDITKDSDCYEAVKIIISKEKGLDVLINCAAKTIVGETITFSAQEYLDILNTNSVGAFRLIQAAAPYMKERRSGLVVNITSMNGLAAFPNYALYSSSKFALEALGLALRYELFDQGIKIVNIAPGAIFKEKTVDQQMPHRSAREKFWLLKLILPMLTVEQVTKKVIQVLEDTNPPARIILGIDAKLVYLLQKLLPQTIWDKLMLKVWRGK